MKALHIRDVDEMVVHRIGKLARFHKRSMQAEVRIILEEAASRADKLKPDTDDGLILVSVDSAKGYGRDELYGDEAR